MIEADRKNSTTSAESANRATRPHLAPRTTTFDRAMRKIDAEAIGGEKAWTPRSAARLYLLAERASADAQNDDAIGELSAVAAARLERIAPARSRNVGDVAAKLAALIVENGHSSPVSSGGIEGTIHAGLCSCLADLVILGEMPLPDVSAVLDMRERDFQLRDATPDEIAEFWAEAQAEKLPQDGEVSAVTADQSAQLVPKDDGRQRDSFRRLTLEGDRLKHALAGWHEILIGLRDLAEKRPISPDALDPLLTEIETMQCELREAGE